MYYLHEADHVIAEKHGGPTSLENLVLACFYCNRFKGLDLASVDPLSDKIVFLFNPCEQRWNRHFRLNGGRIEGITASWRATVALLHFNDAERVTYRFGLIALGQYPPRQESVQPLERTLLKVAHSFTSNRTGGSGFPTFLLEVYKIYS